MSLLISVKYLDDDIIQDCMIYKLEEFKKFIYLTYSYLSSSFKNIV